MTPKLIQRTRAYGHFQLSSLAVRSLHRQDESSPFLGPEKKDTLAWLGYSKVELKKIEETCPNIFSFRHAGCAPFLRLALKNHHFVPRLIEFGNNHPDRFTKILEEHVVVFFRKKESAFF